jgi:hypothetical protein
VFGEPLAPSGDGAVRERIAATRERLRLAMVDLVDRAQVRSGIRLPDDSLSGPP